MSGAEGLAFGSALGLAGLAYALVLVAGLSVMSALIDGLTGSKRDMEREIDGDS